MNLFQSHKDDLDEIVFENRNKLYGAYAIRKSYDANLLKATASSFVFLGLLCSSSYLAPLLRTNSDAAPVTRGVPNGSQELMGNFEILPPEVVEAITGGAPVTNTDNGSYRIVTDRNATPLTNDPPRTDLPLNPDGQTAGNGTDPLNAGTGGGPVGEPGGMPAELLEEEPQFYPTVVEQMPSFPGGSDAMKSYLANALHYPENARSMGVEGKVVVSFVVDTDGEIIHIKVEHAMGYGCDDEALRVISRMPKWIPGKQNGKARAVKLILPIRFNLR
jgi:protein TonB